MVQAALAEGPAPAFVPAPAEKVEIEAASRVDPKLAGELQGILADGYPKLEASAVMFLRFDDAKAARGWLRDLQGAGLVTTATAMRPQRALAVALSFRGVALLGLGSAEATPERRAQAYTGTFLDSFARPFRQGMTEPQRARALGDTSRDEASGTTMTVAEGLRWSGRDTDPSTGKPTAEVHALLLLFAEDGPARTAFLAEVRQRMAAAGGVSEAINAIHTSLEPMAGTHSRTGAPLKLFREHFGFPDGLSQPAAAGAPYTMAASDPWHTIPGGDVVMGYTNAHGELSPGPLVADEQDEGGALPAAMAEGCRDLGLNGSYLVIRQLTQDVAGFWRSMDEAAAKLGKTGEWLAERVIGRTLDGDTLRPGDKVVPASGGKNRPDNAFGFFADDREGTGCPIGSHVRRANPRDGFGRDAKDAQGLLGSVNNHRILRRGRKYGPPVPLERRRDPDGMERGLLFMGLNTDIERQFEFIQETWLLNKTFGDLGTEADPLLGLPGPFTLPDDPIRRKAKVELYVQLVGGDYFFVPSISALRWLAAERS